MNILDFFTKVYSSLRGGDRIPLWVLTPIRRIVRFSAQIILPKYLTKPSKLPSKPCEEDIIVSLTSFPARIENVWQVIECMLRQTLKPNKIFLWLSLDQFSSKECLPESLISKENDIFEIRMVQGDVGSHKKYIYSARDFQNKILFLIDDDIYYPSDILEKSWNKYRENPHSVVCNYGLKINFDQYGKHKLYSQWGPINNDNYIFFGSGGGTLFRPSDLYKDLTNIELAIKLTPTADDIWLNAMTRLSGTKIVHASNNIILPIYTKNNVELSSQNNGKFQNDVQIEAVESYYGRCFDRK